MSIDQIIENAIGREGGYVNHPSDPGGETIWGITVGVARENGYSGPMRNMPREDAVKIYKNIYVVKPGFDKVFNLYPKLAEELIDTGINQGTSRASKYLQRALNALNERGRRYSNVVEDGIVGAGTIAALAKFRSHRGSEGEDVIRKACDIQQGARYLELAANDSKFEDFVYGWLRTRCG